MSAEYTFAYGRRNSLARSSRSLRIEACNIWKEKFYSRIIKINELLFLIDCQEVDFLSSHKGERKMILFH